MQKCLWVTLALAVPLGCSGDGAPTDGPGLSGAARSDFEAPADRMGTRPHGDTTPHPSFGATVIASEPPPPIFGGTLTVSRDGTLAIAADPDRDAIYLVDIGARQLLRTISLPARSYPFRVAEDGAHRAHVTLRGTGQLVTIDLDSGAIVATRDACGEPRGVAWNPADDRVSVACESGALVSFAAAGGGVLGKTTVAQGARDVIVMDDGSLVVSTFRTAALWRVSPAGQVAPVPLANTGLGGQSRVAWRTVRSGGALLMVHQLESNQTVDVAQPGGYGGGGGGPVVSLLASIPMGDLAQAKELEMCNDLTPVDVAASPSGAVTLVVTPANALLAGAPSYFFFGPGEMGNGPCGQGEGPPPIPDNIIAPSGLFVDGQLTAAAFSGLGEPIVFSREPAALYVLGVSTPHAVVAKIPLSPVSRKDTGHDVFHSNSGAGIACASCHPEGGDDAHTWAFASSSAGADADIRRTPSLRGTVAGTAPYHWTGAFPTVGALLDDTYSHRMHGMFLADDQKLAVTSWVGSIAAPHVDHAALPVGGGPGATLFAEHCASCHSGPRYTDNLSHDVGTGLSVQTPPLVGVSARTPLLHDGCALTVRDRFRCGGDHHGDTGAMSETQIDALVDFLGTL